MNNKLPPALRVAAVVLAALVTIGAKSRLDGLIVFGQGFLFSVKEPQGWKGDTTNAAKYSSNIIFYPKSSHSIADAPTIIRVLIVNKTDEHINLDLQSDMNAYHAKYPDIRFSALNVVHAGYAVVAKLFYIPREFYEYVAYVNPGPSSKLMFSVAMNIQGAKASSGEMNAYRKCVASLEMLGR